MRTISADHDAILTRSPKFRVRLQVKDSGGTFRDLSTYALGIDLFKGVTWKEGIDEPGITWTATIAREAMLLSVAPLMSSSGLNRAFGVPGTYNPLLQLGRGMKLEWNLQAAGDPGAGTWNLGFTGYIDAVDASGEGDLVVSGRGEQAKLINYYIKRERIYAFAQGASATRGLYIFEASTTYAVNELVVPTQANLNGHFYKVTSITTGISAAAEPTWPTGGGSTVVSGGVTFTEVGATSTSTGTNVETVLQQLLDDNLGSGVYTLATPVSPGWAIRWFKAGRRVLFEQLRELADQIGWCLRFKFDSGSGTMKLTFYDPLRSTTTSLRTFPSSMTKVKRVSQKIDDIRNTLQVVFSDSQDRDAGGNPKRKTVVVTDTASIAKYSGEMWAEVAEDSNSNIDSTSEATAFANAMLSDMKDPIAEFEADVPLFPFAELPDLYTLAANGEHFDTDQKLALSSYEHRCVADDVRRTTLRFRGTPASGNTVWLQKQTDAYNGSAIPITDAANSAPLSLIADTKPVGGARITFQWDGAKS